MLSLHLLCCLGSFLGRGRTLVYGTLVRPLTLVRSMKLVASSQREVMMGVDFALCREYGTAIKGEGRYLRLGLHRFLSLLSRRSPVVSRAEDPRHTGVAGCISHWGGPFVQ